MKKRLLTVLLALCLVFALGTVTALAVDESSQTAYTTLANEIAAAPHDGTETTITLTGNISGMTSEEILTIQEEQNIILNMAGYSITVDSNFTGWPIVNYGTLTVTGNGTIDSSASEFGGYGAISNYGELTIENGTFEGHVCADGAAIYNRENGTLTINDGYFTGTSAIYNLGVLSIYGGEFWTDSCNQYQDSNGGRNHWAYCVRSGGELYFYDGKVTGVQGALAIFEGYAEVYDGEFETTGCEHSQVGGTSFYAIYIAGERGEVEAHIYGGDFTALYRQALYVANTADGGQNAPALVYVYDGTFTGGSSVGSSMNVSENGSLAITGGTYLKSDDSVDDAAHNYIPTGAALTQNDDGAVVSSGAAAVATVNDVPFTSLESAIAYANDGDTVVVLDDVTLSSNIAISRDITITGATDDVTITVYENQDTENYRIVVRDGATLTLTHLTLEGSYGADVAAPMLSVNDTSKLVIDNCTISDVGTSGYSSGYGLINTMYATAGSKVTITNSVINSQIGSSTNPTYYVLGGAGTCELDIRDNEFNLGSWFVFNMTASGLVQDNVFNGNGDDSSNGRVINSTALAGLVVDDNVFSESLYGTQFVIGGDYTISNNTFEPLGDDLAIGIYDKPDTTSSITGNTFYLDEESYGIRIASDWGEAGSLDTLKIENNVFVGSGVYQIRNDSWTGNIDLSTNDFGDEISIWMRNDSATITITLPEAPSRSGYEFVCWTDGTNRYNAGDVVTVAADTTFTAVWRFSNIPTPHEITIANTANGTVDTSLSNASAGAVITITATPNSGYGVSGVAVTGPDGAVDVTRVDANTYTFVMPDGPVTVSVTFGNGLPFTDVSAGQWFYDYVEYVYVNGLMNGTSATTFEPNANMTRAMVWAILARIDGETVTGESWQTVARTWAMANGVSDGSDPNGLVTREQFATMLWRYAGEPASSYSLASFTDANSVSDWAETAMSWAVEHGVITGITDTTLVPQGSATRAQCAAMLMRFVENAK